MSADATSAVEAIWRTEATRLIAVAARVLGDLDAAEDVAGDALVAALEQWPREGVPRNPAAWLMTTAKRRAIDRRRRDATMVAKAPLLGAGDEDGTAAFEAVGDDDIRGDHLRLLFIACHPLLGRDARVALTLRLIGGLTTEEIARAFLVPIATLQQRIVRAKRTLADARVPFETPPMHERTARLASVLEVVYLIFNEGYAATAGDDWIRPALCLDALRLARSLAALVPDESEVLGLLALLELQASRLRARTDPSGEPIVLADQDRARWDRQAIARGLAALDRARRLDAPLRAYALQATIAAVHAQAASTAHTDWPAIVAAYDQLLVLTPNPIVALNRAVAIGMAHGAAVALPLVDALASEPALARYHLLPCVRADLLERLGERDAARAEWRRAAAMTENARERALLLRRGS
jgi:RNA polymerase sigma factor (sigma-70 family)